MWTTAFQALDTPVELAVEDPALVAILRALTATYAPAASGARLSYHLRTAPRPQLFRDGSLLCTVECDEDLAPVFEHDLYRRVLSRPAPGTCALHAAALAHGEEALLLAGPSGAGKSTLALALVQRGLRYLTDDTVLVDEACSVRGLARPIGLSADSGCPGLGPGFSATPYTFRGRDGSVRGSLLIHPPREQLCYEAAATRCIVFLQHDLQRAAGLRRLCSGEALCRLWGSVLGRDPRALRAAVALAQRCEAHELVTHTVASACESIATLCEPIKKGRR